MWGGGYAYELYMGRWSRLLAAEFVPWLGVPPDARWLDLGCGTGGLTQTVLERAAPESICALDPAEGFLRHARRRIPDPRVRFKCGDARRLPLQSAVYDAVVSGLVLNFIPQPAAALAELRRVTGSGGTVSAYVWDYAAGMEFLRYFWDAAVAGDPAAAELDEGRLFPLCRPEALRKLFEDTGLRQVEVASLAAITRFESFDDYWSPFLGGQGPAPHYVAALGQLDRNALRDRLRAALPIAADGSIELLARAWAIRSTCK